MSLQESREQFYIKAIINNNNVLLSVDVIQSFTYVLRVVILDVTKRRGAPREKARGNTNGLSQIPSSSSCEATAIIMLNILSLYEGSAAKKERKERHVLDYSTIRDWNSLSIDAVEATTVDTFVSRVSH